MCGLITFISKSKNPNITSERMVAQYQDQFRRGTEGFGLVEIEKDGYQIRRSTEPTKAMLDLFSTKARIGMFHHRNPTSTDNKMKQTHPILVSDGSLKYDYLIQHNGVISNATELYLEHTKDLGFVYTTHTGIEVGSHEINGIRYASGYGHKAFNDSEALAIELALYLEGVKTEIGIRGSAAFTALRINKETKQPIELMWGKNDSNPLEYLETEDGILIASAIDNPDAEIIQNNRIEYFDLEKYFNLKNTKKPLSKLVKYDDLKFKDWTPPKPAVVHTPHQNTMGYHSDQINKGSKIAPPARSRGGDLMDDDDITEDQLFGKESDHDIYGSMSPREIAFTKMAERCIEEFSEEIQDFFMQMSSQPMTDDEIAELASKLSDHLIEKEEIANSKVRPFFDHKEDQENDAEEQMAEEAAADAEASMEDFVLPTGDIDESDIKDSRQPLPRHNDRSFRGHADDERDDDASIYRSGNLCDS